MPTEVLHVDAEWPDPGALRRAAMVLAEGGLAAFPTETVYGLGANALDTAAVLKIFKAKGRPPINPLIVHVADAKDARRLVRSWSSAAELLAKRFWPGPLTIVLSKNKLVPDVVTGGGATVALRVPSHPVALGLLEFCRLPVAAPSANRSSGLSPTRGDHVLRSLEDRVDLLLDAGATPGGLESTVIDLTTTPPRLLRPGLIAVADIEAVLGTFITRAGPAAVHPGQPLPSPGMLPRHYAPRTPLEVVPGTGRERVKELASEGCRVGWVTREAETDVPAGTVHHMLPHDPVGYAAQLYAVLHDMDDENLDHIIVARPPDSDAWLAIADRLRRASAVSPFPETGHQLD
jgi:L-threonylcarbamoyladenylate synthase